MSQHRLMQELTRAESLELLGSVQVGRLVFTHHALPAIRPVNHLLVAESIIVRATAGAAIVATADSGGVVVAYEADDIDPDRQLGWSVIVVGTARLLSDEIAAERYRARLKPWVAGSTDDVISISTDMVTGYRMVPGAPSGDSLLVAAGP